MSTNPPLAIECRKVMLSSATAALAHVAIDNSQHRIKEASAMLEHVADIDTEKLILAARAARHRLWDLSTHYAGLYRHSIDKLIDELDAALPPLPGAKK